MNESRPTADAAPVRFRVRVFGRVQGVGFRFSCVQAAREAGTTGWVRNCADGSVEALFQGPREAVEQMVAWCRRGPPGARVDSVEVFPETPEEPLLGFSIRR